MTFKTDVTKIWTLQTTDKGSCFYVKLLFSIYKREEVMHDRFLDLSRKWRGLSNFVFKKEDYFLYLVEKGTEEKLTTAAYRNLLNKRLKDDYIEYNFNPKLYYNEKTNIFSYQEGITKTKTTVAILEELNDIKNEVIEQNYGFTTETYLYSLICSLDYFCD